MWVNDGVASKRSGVDSRCMTAAIGIVDGGSTAAVGHNIHHMMVPDGDHAGAGSRSWKLEPVGCKEKIFDRMTKDLDADSAATKRPTGATGRMPYGVTAIVLNVAITIAGIGLVLVNVHQTMLIPVVVLGLSGGWY